MKESKTSKNEQDLEALQELESALTELTELEERNRLDKLKLTRTQRDFLCDSSGIKLFSGGNGSGKTATMVIDAVLQAQNEHPLQPLGLVAEPPVFIRAMSPTLSDTIDKVLRPEFMKWIRADYFERYDPKHRIIYLKKNSPALGSRIEFMSYDQDIQAYGGGDRSVILCDEPPPKAVFDECTARLREAMGRVLIGMTPVKNNPNVRWIFLDLIEKNKCSTYFGDNMELLKLRFGGDAKKVFNRMAANWSPEEMEIRRYGRFPTLSGMVWEFKKSIAPGGHMVEDFPIPDDYMIVMAMDYHSRTPTHCLWVAISPKGMHFAFKEYASPPGRTDTQIAQDIADIEAKFPNSVYARLIDPSSSNVENRETKATPQRNFSKVMSRGRPILFRPGIRKKEYGLNCVAERLRFDQNGWPGLMFFRNGAKQAIEDIAHYIYGEWYANTDMKTAKQEPLKKDDHYPDCIRYIEAQGFNYKHPVLMERRRTTWAERVGA